MNDEDKIGNAMKLMLASPHIERLKKPAHIIFLFSSGKILLLRTTVTENTIIGATIAPSEMRPPVNGLAVGADNERVDFVWNEEELIELSKSGPN